MAYRLCKPLRLWKNHLQTRRAFDEKTPFPSTVQRARQVLSHDRATHNKPRRACSFVGLEAEPRAVPPHHPREGHATMDGIPRPGGARSAPHRARSTSPSTDCSHGAVADLRAVRALAGRHEVGLGVARRLGGRAARHGGRAPADGVGEVEVVHGAAQRLA